MSQTLNQTVTASKNSIAQAMLEEFERELVATRKFLERIPADKMSWKPHPKSMSAGQLAYHIAETPAQALKFVAQDRQAPPDLSNREEAGSTRELLALLDEGAACLREELPNVEDARMRAIFTIDLPDGSAIELPRQRFLRSIMLNHWYHHRGQLGVYLRLLGVSVPSSYGPSGDEMGGV
ncbi:MAG: DinB family protein [Phycisphaerales bacterium]